MSRIVFLVEELSMRRLLEALLPRLFPGVEFLCIHHEGKQDLARSLSRKLRAWGVPQDRFVVLHDQDATECRALKEQLLGVCAAAGRGDVLVRIVCRELEAWYLGDLEALQAEYGSPRGGAIQARARRLRDPDRLLKPSAELQRLFPAFQKVDGARRLGARLDPATNTSASFRTFVEGLQRVIAAAD